MSRIHRIAAAAAASVLALGLAACAPTSDNSDEQDHSSATFPVTIEHAYGETVIEKEPQRVATLGWITHDVVYSFGITPVSIEANTWAGDAEGYLPWFREAVEADGEKLPATVNVYPEIDMDALIAAEPDIILAPLSGITQEQYDQLSTLAPTVAFPGEAWTTSWHDVITITGKALGHPTHAAEKIAELEELMETTAKDNPEFKDHSFAYVYAGGEPGTLSVYRNGDARVDLITALGMTHAPAVADLPTTEGEFTTVLGLENADKLNDVDVLFTWFNDEAAQAATAAQPLWAQIPAVQRGSTVVVLDRQLGMASTAVSPLSLPWAIDRHVALISEAVAKVG